MKYILIFIKDSKGDNPYDIIPGTMFEVDRFTSIEEASKKAKELGFNKDNSLILQYYDVTD